MTTNTIWADPELKQCQNIFWRVDFMVSSKKSNLLPDICQKFRNLYAKPESEPNWKIIGPSGVRALALAGGVNVGGHYFRYFGLSRVRALLLAAGRNEGGHY
jgi:hypothetical protein